MAWIIPDKVSGLFHGIEATAHNADDVTDKIEEAQIVVEGYLRPRISATTLDAWDEDSCPALVQKIVAHIAAAYILNRYYGQRYMTRGENPTLASELYKEANDLIDAISKGQIQITDVASEAVAPTNNEFFQANSTTSRKFTEGNGSTTCGSMDNLTP